MGVNANNKRRWALLGIALIILGWEIASLARSPLLQTNDFVQYWSAGKLLLLGDNPYSPGRVLELERSLGRPGDIPLLPFSPPWALTFMAPLALFEPHFSRLLWLLAHLAMVAGSIEWSWRFYGGGESGRRIKWLIGAAFAPALTVLIIGQIGPLILFAVAAFLLLETRRQYFLAGILVMPAAVKPQLLFLFWIALLFWSLKQRRWSVLAGIAVAWLFCSLVAAALDPAVFSQYLSLWRSQGVLKQPYPVLGGVLRLVFGAERQWLQFVPSIAGFAWFLFYWRAHRDHWQWREQAPLLLLVSLVTTPYGWFFDQVVLLPVVMKCAIWLLRSGGAAAVQIAGAFVAVNVVALVFIALGLTTFWYLWIAPAWLVLYLIVQRASARVSLASAVLV